MASPAPCWGCLDARLLVIRDDCDVSRGLARYLRISFGAGLRYISFRHPQDGNLLINTQDFGHLGVKFRIALLQVVAHLVRLHLLISEDLVHRALRDSCQGDVAPAAYARGRGGPVTASSRVRASIPHP